MGFLQILVVIALLFLLLRKSITTAAPEFLLIPSHNWREKILKVLQYSKPIYLDVGLKRSSFRRRLVLASSQPSFYTNFVNDKIKIFKDDFDRQKEFIDQMAFRDVRDSRRNVLHGFFHPYANNGGGGEKVLWNAIKGTLIADDRNIVVVYTTNVDAEPLQILKKARDKFNVTDLDHKRILFIYLRKFGPLISDTYWKHFTLLGQLIGSFMLSLEALYELSPDIWVDTMGLPGSYFLVSKILTLPIISYVHYPILQEEMFNKLKFRSISELSAFTFSLYDFKALTKLVYWSILYYTYRYLGSKVTMVFTNGTWTFNHLSKVWSLRLKDITRFEILYPPCFPPQKPEVQTNKENTLLYVGQFRPEKRHSLVLSEYALFLKNSRLNKTRINQIPKMVFAGSCRTTDDTETLAELRRLVGELHLEDLVEFKVDISYEEMLHELKRARFGLNAMWNEHFGIGVVEYLRYGVVPLCHGSAGPWLDIVINPDGEANHRFSNEVGCFFKSKEDPDFDSNLQIGDKYIQFKMGREIISFPSLADLIGELSSQNVLIMAQRAMISCERFSDRVFLDKWTKFAQEAMALEILYREERTGILKVY